MIRQVVAAAAALVSLGLSSGAEAASGEPLNSAPLVYDANDKLVGPYYLGTTYVDIGGKVYEIGIGVNDFRMTAGVYIFYSEENCQGDAYYGQFDTPGAYELDLAPQLFVTENRIFIPNGAPRTVDVKSYKPINSRLNCKNQSSTGLKLPLLRKSKAFLGVTFPVKLVPPNAVSR